MEEIARGAEAILYKKDNDLIKQRIEKGYRIKEIDEKLRKERTKREASLLGEARRLGVNTPVIKEVKEFEIIMEFVDGKRLKELINESGEAEIAEEIGKATGLLHNGDIVHGDLTTSNMILKDDKIYFIDFGLGGFTSRNEDKGTDLSLIKEAFKSTHCKYLDSLWKNFIKGYKQSNPRAEEVLKVLEDIEKRGRYVKR
jgi:Kae1-associated kinase Bud32